MYRPTPPDLPEAPRPLGIAEGTPAPVPPGAPDALEDEASRDRELVRRLTTFFHVPSDVL